MKFVVKLILFIILLMMASFYTGWYFGQHGVPFLKKQQEWSIGIYTGEGPFDVESISTNPVLTREDVTDVEALFVADPFLIQVNETWYMFFEVKRAYDYQTDIAYATSVDGKIWDYGGIVLNEQFSQSYPQVFEWEGEYYMIPESYPTNSIRLYKAHNFPEEWILEDILIIGKDYVDSTILRHNNKWWIFTSTTKNEDLYLFYADDLSGTWTEHPESPIVYGDANIARPGGGVIEYEENLYRVTQDDAPYYGNSVRVFKILDLTEETYKEVEIPESPVLEKGVLSWNNRGMHTFDAHKFGEGWIVAVDGYKQSIVWEE